MSAFLWMNAELAASAAGKRARDLFRQQAMAELTALESVGSLDYAASGANRPCWHRDRQGSFTALTGTPYGPVPAGEDLATHLHANPGLLSDLIGGYVCLRGRVGELSLQQDPMGQQHLWHDRQMRVFSTSYLAVVTAIGGGALDKQALYEYVFFGATYGGASLCEDVKLLPAGSCVDIRQGTVQISPGPVPTALPFQGDFTEAVQQVSSLLHRNAGWMNALGAGFDSALSGGFDSRLILAMLRSVAAQDIKLYVYGTPDSPDVAIAQHIAGELGLNLDHTNKETLQLDNSEAWEQALARNFLLFDGLPPDGIVDAGADLQTRLTRARPGRVNLNGGGGEVLRNFFYLPDRCYLVSELLDVFYRRYDPVIAGARFDEGDFRQRFGAKLLTAIDREGSLETRLERSDVERVYPLLRGRFWMDSNTSLLLRFGAAITPFTSFDLVSLSSGLPIGFKTLGRLEAAVIKQISPELARFRSDYGFNFWDGPGRLYRAKALATIYRPCWLRRNTFRLKHRMRPQLQPPTGMQASRWHDWGLGDYFDFPAMRDPEQARRLVTAGYAMDALGIRH